MNDEISKIEVNMVNLKSMNLLMNGFEKMKERGRKK